ncbi:protein of unknown function [Pararobbsia alpina]
MLNDSGTDRIRASTAPARVDLNLKESSDEKDGIGSLAWRLQGRQRRDLDTNRRAEGRALRRRSTI